ncbi:MAG: hypothetical protein KIC84_05265 [Dysgonomonas mossii]|uniref:hypothetical protein n=1 Tax=Dysgonomonas mossii TaxID=163665 RepID=UPI0026F2049C|nr:hypothetical protein [Dysgonomonas mossii]MBS5906619.1 hypothetical protein [Dysgonomonas mossii]
MRVNIQKNSVKRIGDQIKIDISIDIYHESLTDNEIIEITPVMGHENKKKAYYIR